MSKRDKDKIKKDKRPRRRTPKIETEEDYDLFLQIAKAAAKGMVSK